MSAPSLSTRDHCATNRRNQLRIWHRCMNVQPHSTPNGGTDRPTACTHPPRPNCSARQRVVLPRIDATKSALGVRSRRPTVARPRPATLRLTSEHQTNSFTVAKIVHFHHGGFYSSVSQSDQPQTPLGPARKLQRHTLTLSACLLQHSPPPPPRCRHIIVLLLIPASKPVPTASLLSSSRPLLANLRRKAIFFGLLSGRSGSLTFNRAHRAASSR